MCACCTQMITWRNQHPSSRIGRRLGRARTNHQGFQGVSRRATAWAGVGSRSCRSMVMEGMVASDFYLEFTALPRVTVETADWSRERTCDRVRYFLRRFAIIYRCCT